MTATEILAEAAIASATTSRRPKSPAWRSAAAWSRRTCAFGKKVLSPQITPGTPTCCSASRRPKACAGATCCARRPGADEHRRAWCRRWSRSACTITRTTRSPNARPGTRVHAFDAIGDRQELGDVRLGNTVMLGAIADHLPFSAEVLERCISSASRARRRSSVELNRRPSPPAARRRTGGESRSRDENR
jgi:indolepyruvate ferredoxin oxidoreductase beta subunit